MPSLDFYRGEAVSRFEGATGSRGSQLPSGGRLMRNYDRAGGVRWRDAALMAYARAFEHPCKIRIVRWLARRLAADRVYVRYASGTIVAIDPADYIGWTIFTTGRYESASLDLALRLVGEEPGLFIDVGAHLGWYTCAIGAIAGSSIISIEPDCENCAWLRRNIALNRLQNATVFSGAVGAEFESVQIGRRSRGNSGTAAIGSGDREQDRRADWVATVPLGVLLGRIVGAPVRPVLMKLDVEGAERQVLAGLDFNGPFRPKNILFEFDRQLSAASWESFEDVHSFFLARGYQLFDVLGAPLTACAAIPEDNVWARERTAG
jgi:FkbM family methyltransferase